MKEKGMRERGCKERKRMRAQKGEEGDEKNEEWFEI